jgi:hypothetical protein
MSPLERAFELAGSGKYLTVEELKRTLSREGYSTHQVYGRSLTKQLSTLMLAAREKLRYESDQSGTLG